MKPDDLVNDLVLGGVPQELAESLLAEWIETKRRYFLADHRPTSIGGGRFAEAVLRIIENSLFGTYTPIGSQLSGLGTQRLQHFEAVSTSNDSLRFHIPRAVFSIYGVRNKRDSAHLADGIDPNLQDSIYVVGAMDWILAELVRLFCKTSPAEAVAAIARIMTREVPVIEEIDGQPVCSKNLQVGELILVFLYRADSGITVSELQAQMRHPDKGNLSKAVKRLDTKRLVLLHPKTSFLHITSLGRRAVEERNLLQPAS
jgi:hypothetical protein